MSLFDGQRITAPPLALPHSHELKGHHILTATQFNKEQLNDIFNFAQTLRTYVQKGRHIDILKVL